MDRITPDTVTVYKFLFLALGAVFVYVLYTFGQTVDKFVATLDKFFLVNVNYIVTPTDPRQWRSY